MRRSNWDYEIWGLQSSNIVALCFYLFIYALMKNTIPWRSLEHDHNHYESIWSLLEQIEIWRHWLWLAMEYLRSLWIIKETRQEDINKEMNEYWFCVTDKISQTYWPDRWNIKWAIRDIMSPKDVYRLVNPNNEYCMFDISIPWKHYFFLVKKNWN